MIKNADIPNNKCPGCCHRLRMTVFFELENAPVFCNVLWDSREDAIAVPRAPIQLVYCHECGLMSNIAFDPHLMEYSPNYENSLHFSPRFQKYARNLAKHLIDRYDLHNKHIIEIGCANGEFLTLLSELGRNRGVGFDPSYELEETSTNSGKSDVSIVPEAYSEQHVNYPTDFICCRHLLEHINQPLDFLQSVRKAIGRRQNCVVYFEVPNALYTFKEMGVWDIIYEHCSYFTSASLSNLFLKAGFEPIKVAEQYDGQFLAIEAQAVTIDTGSSLDGKRPCSDITESVRNFHHGYKDKVNLWQRTLSLFQKQRSRVVLWGAGSKGVTFLNVLDVSYKHIEYIVDVNPRKQGKFVAGTGQQVVAPNFLKEYFPHTIIVMNPIYHSEIQQTIQDLGLSSEILLA